MDNISIIGLDLAKNVFQAHGATKAGHRVLSKNISRAGLVAFFSSIPPCLVAKEACASAHHWGRRLAERDLLSERVKSGLAAAWARGKKLGRQPVQRPTSDKLAPKMLQAVENGRSYQWIARDLGISKNTVTDIVRQHRQDAS